MNFMLERESGIAAVYPGLDNPDGHVAILLKYFNCTWVIAIHQNADLLQELISRPLQAEAQQEATIQAHLRQHPRRQLRPLERLSLKTLAPKLNWHEIKLTESMAGWFHYLDG
jgi:hypothetical protein